MTKRDKVRPQNTKIFAILSRKLSLLSYNFQSFASSLRQKGFINHGLDFRMYRMLMHLYRWMDGDGELADT